MHDLPKRLNKREAKWTTAKGNKWCEEHLIPPFLVEFKHAKNKDYISFKEIRPSQRRWLAVATGEKCKVWKIPDDSRGAKPADGVGIGLIDYWIVIKYPKGGVCIAGDILMEEEQRSSRKSLTWNRAQKIARHIL